MQQEGVEVDETEIADRQLLQLLHRNVQLRDVIPILCGNNNATERMIDNRQRLHLLALLDEVDEVRHVLLVDPRDLGICGSERTTRNTVDGQRGKHGGNAVL